MGVGIACTAVAAATNTRTTVSLDTDAWQLSGWAFGEGEKRGLASKPERAIGSIPVMIPNDVQLTSFVKDPLGQSPDLIEVNNKEWWYTKRFETPHGAAGREVRLLFDGVDYFADVWLNGVKLGSHEGAYTQFEFDVTDRLSKSGTNYLAVRVTSPWKLPGRSHYEFMKGEYEENWDALPGPGQVVFPLGLHRHVRLEMTAPTHIDDIHVWTAGLKDGTANVRSSVHVVTQGKPVTGSIEVTLEPENFTGPAVTLTPRSFSTSGGIHGGAQVDFTAEVKDAHLWWTWDLGSQNLYRAEVVIKDQHGAVLDASSAIFGIRTLERDAQYQYRLNGRRILSRGANYAMSQLYPASLDRWTYEKDLRLARHAGMNSILNYTVVGTDDFYDLADRLGMLIFEELPFNQEGPIDALNDNYPRKQAFLDWSARETAQIIRQLRNHPAIGVWSPVSEVTKNGHDIQVDWDTRVAAATAGYLQFLKVIEEVVAREDPQTLYHPSYCDFNEEHYWNGGIADGTTYDQTLAASTSFVSEYGMMAFYPVEDAARAVDLDKLWGVDPMDRSSIQAPVRLKEFSYVHPWQNTGVDSLSSAIGANVTLDIKTFRDYVNASQVYQSFIYQFAGDSFRRKLYNPINGIRSWMFKSFHRVPIGGFGVIDAFDTPLPAYYAQKKTFQPITLSFAMSNPLESVPGGSVLSVPIWVSNFPETALSNLSLQYTLYDLNGRVIQTDHVSAAIEAGRAAQVATANLQLPKQAGVYLLRGQLHRGVEELASASSYVKVSAPATARPLRVLVIGTPDWAEPVADYLEAFGTRVTLAVDEETVIHPPHFPSSAAEVKRDYDVIWLAGYDNYWREAPRSLAPVILEAVKGGVTFVHTGSSGSFHGGAVKTAALDLTPVAEVLPVQMEHMNDVFEKLVYRTGTLTNALAAHETFHIGATAAAPAWLRDISFDSLAPESFHMLAAKPGAEVLLKLDALPLLVTGRYGKGRTIAYLGFSPKGVPGADHKRVILDRAIRDSAEGRLFGTMAATLLTLASGEQPAAGIAESIADRARPFFQPLLARSPATVATLSATWTKDADGHPKAHVKIVNGDHFNFGLRVRLAGPDVESGSVLPLWNDQYFDLLPHEAVETDVTVWQSGRDPLKQLTFIAQTLDGKETSYAGSAASGSEK
jgi:beta-mannosidase